MESVDIFFELGHTSYVKAHIWDDPDYRPRDNEAIYDWEFHVGDKNKGDMKQYVDKVVVSLHETFPNPKRGVLPFCGIL